MPVIAEKRGRHSKHQHNIDTAVSVVVNGGAKGAGGGPSVGWNESMHTSKLTMYQVPDAFSMILESIVVELGQLELRALHQILCDVYAGPAICLLVQVRGWESEGRKVDREGGREGSRIGWKRR